MAGMTELEERLEQPGAAALRAELVERLGAIHTRLRRGIADGVPRGEFEAWEAAEDAAAAAIEVLQRLPGELRSP
jgi:hypothetical protein